jgi:hypothetical protein
MAKLNITPQNVQLAEMKSPTFDCKDDQGNPLPVTWTTAPPAIGTLDPASALSASLKYTAPQQVSNAQAIIITATAGADTASTTVFLTPIAVQIVPAAVQLKPTQLQQFTAIVAGDPTNKVTWLLSPAVGKITSDGVYTPDPALIDSASVKVTAISALGLRTADASVTLVPLPWTGWKRNILGFYMLGIFSLVFLLVALWPPPAPDAAKTAAKNDAQAHVNVDNENKDFAVDANKLKDANAAKDKADADKSTSKDTLDQLTKDLAAAKQKVNDDNKKITEDSEALKVAKEAECLSVNVDACPDGSSTQSLAIISLPRDIDLIFLVLIGGALGAFLHSARSFTDFVGNEVLKSSWAWWYYLHPFLGAILALTFYAAVRGGFLAISTGTPVKTQDLSPFAITSIAVLVGMFSKIATKKLGEIFETIFQPSKSANEKDKLGSTIPPTAKTEGSPKTSPNVPAPSTSNAGGTGAANPNSGSPDAG